MSLATSQWQWSSPGCHRESNGNIIIYHPIPSRRPLATDAIIIIRSSNWTLLQTSSRADRPSTSDQVRRQQQQSDEDDKKKLTMEDTAM